MTPLPIALATSSPERRQKLLARGIAETLADSKELARRLRVAREQRAAQAPGRAPRPPPTLAQSKAFAEQHNARSRLSGARTLEESFALAERWRQYTAGSGARTMKEAFALAARLKEPPRRVAPAPLPQSPPTGRVLLPRTLEESIAFAKSLPKSPIANTLEEAKAMAEAHTARVAGSMANTLEAAKALGEWSRARSEAAQALYAKPGSVVGNANVRAPGPAITARDKPGGSPGAGTNPVLPAAEPLTFQNALWTRFDPPPGIRITDIAAGAATVTSPGGPLRRRVVWATGVEATGALTFVYRVKADGTFEKQLNVLSAEPPLPVQVVASRDTAQPFVFQRDSPVWTRSTTANDWQLLWSYAGIVDLAVGKLGNVYAPEIWWVDDAGFLYQVELSGDSRLSTNTRRASNIARVSIAVDGTLWTVDRDGRVLRGTTIAISADGFATDVAAAPGGDVYAIGTKRAKDAVTSSGTIRAAGNEIWWWNHFTETWTKVEPGWGVAIDVDDDGTLWVVDENGTLLNRGARQLGFWELTFRSRPHPGEGWCAYLDATTEPANPIGKDAVEHFVASGATTIRVGQGFNDGTIAEPANLLGAAGLGVDVFLLIGVIATKTKGVPADLLTTSFGAPAMLARFRTFFSSFKQNVDAALAPHGQAFEDVIKYISIGGEVDIFLQTTPVSDYRHGDLWSNWNTFYQGASAHIRNLVPATKVGCVLSLHGLHDLTGAFLLSQQQENWPAVLNESSDYAGFTSYPQMRGYTLDEPANSVHGANYYSVQDRIDQMLTIAGDLPVVVEEFGYPTYDEPTVRALGDAWPDRPAPWVFPNSFYSPDGEGEESQREAVDLAFKAWDQARLRIPLFVWFTQYEVHIEGRPCHCLPGTKAADRGYCEPAATDCNPCVDPKCHLCAFREGIDALGTGTSTPDAENGARFFESCGLIRADGEEKPAWGELVDQTLRRRVPRGPV